MKRLVFLALFAVLLRAQLSGPDNDSPASTLLYRGLSLAQSNDLAQAARLFAQGVELYPGDKRFPLELAGIAWRRKNGSDAKRYLHGALKIDPEDNYGNDFLGTLYLFDQNLEAAFKYWNRIDKPLIQTLRFEPDPPFERVLRDRTFDISPGQVFTLKRLATTEANLSRLNVHGDTRFDLMPRADDRVDLAVRAVTAVQPLRGWPGRILPLLRDLPYRGIDLDFDDIHRHAVNFASLWRWDPDKRRINLSIAGPVRGDPRQEYRYFIDARDETWNLLPFVYRGGLSGLVLRRTEAGASYEVGFSPKLQWTVGGVLSYRDYRHVPAGAVFSNGWSAELRNRFDARLWSWPEHRVHVDGWASLETGRFFAASPSRLITTRAGLAGTWTPREKGDTYSVTQQMQTGRTFGNAPLDELFMLGMERDNDSGLWLRGVSGARDGHKGSAPLGRECAISQTDFERRLIRIPFVRLDAGPFFDAGWIANSSGQFGSRGALYATGVQARVKTVSGVHVKLVYGRDLVSGRGVFYTAVSR